MARLTAAQLYAINRQAGFNPAQAVMMTAIQLGESGGRSDAVGDVALENATWGPSVGTSQIRTLKAQTGTGGLRDVLRLTDPLANAMAAYSLSGRGTDWSPWSVYNSGAYNRDDGSGSTPLQKAQAAAAAAGDASGSAAAAEITPTSGPLGWLWNKATAATVSAVRDLTIQALFAGAGIGLVLLGAGHLMSPARESITATYDGARSAVRKAVVGT